MLNRKLLGIFLLLLVAAGLFMTLGVNGHWDFVLPFRGIKLFALLVVGTAIAVSTMLFQTVSGNRILTPSIMGFDALYVLMQTTLVFTIGGFGYATLDPRLKFFAELVLLLVAALLLFGTLLSRSRQDLHRMVLVGIIFGVLFRSLSSFLQRIIDPNEFAVVQGASFASFNRVDPDLLWVSTALVGFTLIVVWRLRFVLNVIALGRDNAVNLGVAYNRLVLLILVLVAILVSVSTALVGPVVFFGLLVTSLAHQIMRTHRHELLLPAAAMIAALVLVAGQTVFERILGLQTTLSVVVEFLGGLLFLAILLKGKNYD